LVVDSFIIALFHHSYKSKTEKKDEVSNLDDSGSVWLGVFVGFLIISFLGWILPIIAHLIGGFFAGLIARGMGRGALAGFLAGLFGGVIATVLLISGLVTLTGFLSGFIGGLMSTSLGLAIQIVAILLNIFGVLVALGLGIFGGLVREIIETS
jgi:hypothetical protein